MEIGVITKHPGYHLINEGVVQEVKKFLGYCELGFVTE